MTIRCSGNIFKNHMKMNIIELKEQDTTFFLINILKKHLKYCIHKVKLNSKTDMSKRNKIRIDP
jgi:hypothetical protein